MAGAGPAIRFTFRPDLQHLQSLAARGFSKDAQAFRAASAAEWSATAAPLLEPTAEWSSLSPGVNLTIPIRLSDAEFALRQGVMECFRQFI